jgi:diguanylate cyclase (GGDEF)-like protein
LPEIPALDAERVAERLRASIEKFRLPEAAGTEQVTVSVGVARSHPADHQTELFTRADAAMYEAKRRGGNLIFVSEAEGFRPHDRQAS